MSIIKSVRDFFCGCPYLLKGRFNVDYLGSEPTEYSIRRISGDEVLKRYADGGALKKFVFAFSSRTKTGMVSDNIETAAFYEKVSDWIAEKNNAGILPALPDGKVAQSLRVSKAAAMEDMVDDCAKYSMECTLIYFEGGYTYGK